MIDVKLPLRTAYYQLLFNVITYNAATIPVGDDMAKFQDQATTLWILLGSQPGQDTSTFASFDSREQLVVQICFRAKGQSSRMPLDLIASQILNLVLPAPGYTGLPAQFGILIQNVQKIQDQYLDLNLNSGTTLARRIITFTQTVRQTGQSIIPNVPLMGATGIIYGEQLIGTINGSNTVFTTVSKFLSTNYISIYVNGLKQLAGVHFTASGTNTITFADAPSVDGINGPDILLADYISTT